MSILENVRTQKIERLKTLNQHITAIINEIEPEVNQLEQDISELTEAIGDGAVQEEVEYGLQGLYKRKG